MKKKREVAKFRKYCEYCGKEFMAKRSKARFCCDSHRAAYAVRREENRVDLKRAELRNKMYDLVDNLGKESGGIKNQELKDRLCNWIFKMGDVALDSVHKGDVNHLQRIVDNLEAIAPE